MAENLLEAAVLTVTGMLVVFAALALLMVTIVALTKLTSRKEKGTDVAAVAMGEVVKPSTESIAVMAVGLACVMEKADVVTAKDKGKALPQRPPVSSPWSKAGREELMRSRGKVGRQWGKRSR